MVTFSTCKAVSSQLHYLSDNSITDDDIFLAVKSLKLEKAACNDKIQLEMLKSSEQKRNSLIDPSASVGRNSKNGPKLCKQRSYRSL